MNKSILIVDDDEAIRNFLKFILEKNGFKTLMAENGNEALEQFNNNQVDLVITDIVMPEKEGLEFIYELRNNDTNLKIIAISGGGKHIPDYYLALANEFGVNASIKKPFTEDDILQVINNLLV